MVLSSAFVVPAAARAQTAASTSTGFATGFIGVTRGGDVPDRAWTPGASVAVVDERGVGAELDISHVRNFNKARLVESRLTSLMINVTGIWPDVTALVRPYAVGGVGLLLARACVADCQGAVSGTHAGVDAGGGVFVIVNELIGVRGDVRYFRYVQRTDLPLTEQGFFDFWRTTIGATITWPIR